MAQVSNIEVKLHQRLACIYICMQSHSEATVLRICGQELMLPNVTRVKVFCCALATDRSTSSDRLNSRLKSELRTASFAHVATDRLMPDEPHAVEGSRLRHCPTTLSASGLAQVSTIHLENGEQNVGESTAGPRESEAVKSRAMIDLVSVAMPIAANVLGWG